MLIHFQQEELKTLPTPSESPAPSPSAEVEESIEMIAFVITPLPTKRSITSVLMRAKDHFPLPENVTKLTKDVQQYNAIVHYIKECGYGVSGTNMIEYAVNKFK